MGFKKQVQDNLEKINEKLNGFVPTNTIAIVNQIEAVNEAINSQIAKSSVLKDITWNSWIIINHWADYFANSFKYEADRFELNIFINRVIRYAFIYGGAYIWNNNGTPELVSIVSEVNKKEYGIAIISPDFDVIKQNENSLKNLSVSKKVPKEQIFYYQFNSLGWSSFVVLRPLIKWNKQVMKALYNETIMLPTRLIHDTEAGQKDSSASSQLLKFESPVMHRAKDGTDVFKSLALNTNTESLLNVIEYTKNYYYEILGRRANTEYKKTHSLNAELEAAEDTFTILERDRYLYLKNFLRYMSKTYKTKILLQTENRQFIDVFESDIITKNEVNNDQKNKD